MTRKEGLKFSQDHLKENALKSQCKISYLLNSVGFERLLQQKFDKNLDLVCT